MFQWHDSHFQLKKKDRRVGQTIIEILIATGVVALVMTAVVAVVSVSVRNASRAKAKALATKYTQEGIEYFRAQRNIMGWESFWTTAGGQVGTRTSTACLATLPYTATGGLQNVISTTCSTNQYIDTRQIYQRSAAVTTSQLVGKDTVNVAVTVRWVDGSRTNTSTATVQLQQSQN